MNAVILLFHGSRNSDAAREAAAIAEAVARRVPGARVTHAFLQWSTPPLPEAIAAAVAAGATRVDLLPLLVLTGSHVARDVPALVETARAAHPGVDLRLHGHLGTESAFVDLLATLAAG